MSTSNIKKLPVVGGTLESLFIQQCRRLRFGVPVCFALLAFAVCAQVRDSEKLELVVETGLVAEFPTCTFSADGRVMACIDGGRSVKLWDVKTLGFLRAFSLHELNERYSFASAIAFAPTGYRLAVAHRDRTISVIDVETGETVAGMYTEHAQGADDLAFSRDGSTLSSVDTLGKVFVWDLSTGQAIRTFESTLQTISGVRFAPAGNAVAFFWKGVELRDLRGEILWTIPEQAELITDIAFSSDGLLMVTGQYDGNLTLWDAATGRKLRSLSTRPSSISAVAFSGVARNGRIAFGTKDGALGIVDVQTGKVRWEAGGGTGEINSVAFTRDGRMLAAAGKTSIVFRNADNGGTVPSPNGHVDPIRWARIEPKTGMLVLSGRDESVYSLEFGGSSSVRSLERTAGSIARYVSHDGSIVLTGFRDGTVHINDLPTTRLRQTLKVTNGPIAALGLSPNLEILAAGSGRRISLVNLKTNQTVRTIDGSFEPGALYFSPDSGTLAATGDREVDLWDLSTGISKLDPNVSYEARLKLALNEVPDLARYDSFGLPSNSLSFYSGDNGEIAVYSPRSAKIASIFKIDRSDWFITTPDGRFDTNKDLDDISGIHWVINDRTLEPLPVDVFMRQYYEPGLLSRMLRCHGFRDRGGTDTCDKEFKPLPAIANIDRVQAKITTSAVSDVNDDGTVDVTVAVQSITDEVAVDADRTKEKQLSSGVYDLRLFRDGQLIGTSASREKLQGYIDKAPAEVAKDQEAYRNDPKNASLLLNTNEDKLWRDANVIIPNVAGEKGYSGSTCVVDPRVPTKAVCTFKNVQLPRDGRKEIEFTAYAFNADRVKSDTATLKYMLPASIASAPPRKGRAHVVSIGVNASENPQYNLQYAANDARKMQEIVGARLNAEKDKYAEIVEVPLISDFGNDRKSTDAAPVENAAQKAIIKGVFSLLAGNGKDVPPEILKQIPNRDNIKAVEPEDTLIITYSGHGYADQAGIFYLLPYDIGKDTTQLSPDVLKKMISSDELSLWMRGITATEMVMIIDACHSAAAVQGDGFKPGPMGSRGLGQLSYDKGMKVLSATQADNVALELGSLQQGLLSYALLEDGVNGKLADTNKDKYLTATEWLTYAVARVPELYQEVKDGKRGILLNGKEVKDATARAELVGAGAKQKSSLDLQRPSLFDFKKRNKDRAFLALN